MIIQHPTRKLLFALCLLAQATVSAQSDVVEFSEPKAKLERPKKEPLLKQFKIKATGLTAGTAYVIKAVVDQARTTIGPTSYALEQPSSSFTPTGTDHELTFLLKLNVDTEADRERTLVLELDIAKGGTDITATNTGTVKNLDITLVSSTPLETYRYLVYVGTNFDLVDGPKAKNLFFATNIYLPNRDTKGFKSGAFISLYGNRPVSLIDSAGITRRLVRVESTGDSTYSSIYEKAERTTVFTSDNLGAYFAPLINLGGLSNYDNEIALYFAPSAEFIFRRTNRITTYTNGTPADTVMSTGVRTTNDLPDRYATESNTYEFRYGAGVMLAHEKEKMSVRLYCSIGASSLYLPRFPTSSTSTTETPFDRVSGNLSFSGRIWITERTSGITVQAEIVNSIKRPRPYYGVTLSKAIDFKDLGGVFKPLGRD